MSFEDENDPYEETDHWKPPVQDKVPHNPEAEAALLGSMMIVNDLIDNVAMRVSVNDFYDAFHARVFQKIMDLHEAGSVANPVTLVPFFKDEWLRFERPKDDRGRNRRPEKVRASAYLAHMTGSGAGVIGALDFADQVRDLARLRALNTIYVEAAAAANDTSMDVDPARIVADVERQTDDYSDRARSMGTVKFGPAWSDEMQTIEKIGTGEIRQGLMIEGYTDFNDVAGPLVAGDLILVGGRPSMGKTGMGLAIAAGAAAAGVGVDILQVEMNRPATIHRMMANIIYEPGVTSPYEKLKSGDLSITDWRHITQAREMIDGWDLTISCPDEIFVEDIGPHIRRRKRDLARKGQSLGLVVADYLGRFQTREHFRNPNDRVSYMSRTFKDIAKKEAVPIVLLVQLSRGTESRDDKRPVLSDLRDSGSLEQDADVVCFVYRDEYYVERREPALSSPKHVMWEEEMLAAADRIEFYSAKRREGKLCKRTGFYFASHQAIRPSNFKKTDLFSRLDDDDLPEERG